MCNRKRKKAGDQHAGLREAAGNAVEMQRCSDTVRHTHTLAYGQQMALILPGESHMCSMTPVIVSHDAAVPYGGKKKAWCWASYLEQERAIAAPSKLFKEVRQHTLVVDVTIMKENDLLIPLLYTHKYVNKLTPSWKKINVLLIRKM